MRLFNYTFVVGNREISNIATTSPTANLICSGIVGDGNADLDKKVGGELVMFATPFGDEDESPYGNSRLYNVGRVNTSIETSLSQSFSAPMTGSVRANFIFVVESNYRG